MHKLIITFWLICLCALQAFSEKEKLTSTLLEDYYRDMASREDLSPEARIIWYDSLLNIGCPDYFDIQLKKIVLLRDAGHTEQALRILRKLMVESQNLPINHSLPLLYQYASAFSDRNDLLNALTGYADVLDMHKPDSLKYWDIRAHQDLFSIYCDLRDEAKAEHCLKAIETIISSYHFTKEFREDTEGRVRSSRATLLIHHQDYDSAYKELKIVLELARTDPTRFATLMQMAQICLEQGQTEAARMYLDEADQLKKVSNYMRRTALYLKAQSYLADNNFKEVLNVLDSYPQEMLDMNSLNNCRGYYIIRGQSYAGMGNFHLAYDALESALIVGDSIIANTERFVSRNSETYLQTKREADRANAAARSMKGWIIALCIVILIIASTSTLLLFTIIRLRRRLKMQRNAVNNSRMQSLTSELNQNLNKQREEEMSRKQTSLLLKMAQMESAFEVIKKRLSNDQLDKASQEYILSKLHEIAGKKKMWDMFSAQFEMTNSKFLDLLSTRHPDLTKSEKRICAFMLINLSTKEIAELLDRSPRTVDVTKYNIRKKLNTDLSTDEYLRRLAEEASSHV